MTPLLPHVRLYEQARTAHLEREGGAVPTTLLYSHRRYDFDEALAEQVGARRVSTSGAVRLLWGSSVRVLEVTEPAFLPGVVRAASCVAALRLRRRLGLGRCPLVVTYAIGNADPRNEYQPRTLREQMSFRAKWGLARLLLRWTDRIAFGTPASVTTYRRLFGTRVGQERLLIPALPTRCTCGVEMPLRHSLVFLGAFVPRKGLDLLLDAWPSIAEAVPGATLTLVGKGALAGRVETLADSDPRVTALHDPPRAAIHQVLRRSSVLVLPSQPSPTWREQVGLPIVEALQHGCTVVTTDETGLAPWLAEHGHRVIPGTGTTTMLQAQVVDALLNPLPREQVFASLPAEDGRAAAHAWLFRPADGD